mgnify:CR=1 FL=1
MGTRRTGPKPSVTTKLDLFMRQQLASEWGWAAVSQAVQQFFMPGPWTPQCQIVGQCRHRRMDLCCGMDHAPILTGDCNFPCCLHTALQELGLLANASGDPDKPWIDGPAEFSVIQSQVNPGKPACLMVRWRSRSGNAGGHFIMIFGHAVSESGVEFVYVRDPMRPSSIRQCNYSVLADPHGGYQHGRGVWKYTFLVQDPASKATPGELANA